MIKFFRPAPWRQQLPRTIKQRFYPSGQEVLTHRCSLCLTWILLTAWEGGGLPGSLRQGLGYQKLQLLKP